MNLLKNIYYFQRDLPWLLFLNKIKKELFPKSKWSNNNLSNYDQWIKKNEPAQSEIKHQDQKCFRYQPKLSIIVDLCIKKEEIIKSCINSILAQTYDNWELVLWNKDSFQSDFLNKQLSLYSDKISLINSSDLEQLINKTSGSWILWLDSTHSLSLFSLYEVVNLLQEKPKIDFIYGDNDLISGIGKRIEPNFKPGWSPDLLRSFDYIGSVFAFKKDLYFKSRFRKELRPEQLPFGLSLSLSEIANHVFHINRILSHQLSEKEKYSHTQLVSEYCEFLNEKVEVKPGKTEQSSEISYGGQKKVSIIIPNKNSFTLLKRCLSSILGNTSFKDFEIIIVENNSESEELFKYYSEINKQPNIKVITFSGEFNFSKVNNFAAKEASGDFLLFLNNDTEVISKNWLQKLVGLLNRDKTGVVGAKLLYPDGKLIQHAGIALGVGWYSDHIHKNQKADEGGYQGRLNFIQNFSAVTGACLMVPKELFLKVGGFDPNLAITFNDIDLCQKIRAEGFNIVWTPFVKLYHGESKSRGKDLTLRKVLRFIKETQYFKAKWQGKRVAEEIFYSQNCSKISANFRLGD